MNKLFKLIKYLLVCLFILFPCSKEKIRVVDSEGLVINTTLFSKMDKEKLNIYFYDLGTSKNGDSFIITYKDIQILVDAGAVQDKSEYITQNIEYFLENDLGKKWEYVIFTHPHEDHIANASNVLSFLNNNYALENIIDFDSKSDSSKVSDDLTNDDNGDKSFSDLDLYKNYRLVREMLVNYEGTNHYTQSDLIQINDEGVISYKYFEIDKNENIYLTILYNQYINDDSTDVNNLSICFLLTYRNQKMLFTGDLEETGERKLLQNNKEIIIDKQRVTLEGVTFFKAGHHGSRTANSEQFIDYIRPNYVAVSCSADTTQYRFTSEDNKFPSVSAMNNIFKYTDHIYVTNKENKTLENFYEPYHGNILFMFDGEKCDVYSTHFCNENNIAYDIQNTDWFKEKRNEICQIYTFDSNEKVSSNCTLVKYGHYDILIDCGSSNYNSDYFKTQIRNYCVDGILECVIVSHYQLDAYSGLASENGIVFDDYFTIEKVIDSGNMMTYSQAKLPVFSKYKDFVNKLGKNYLDVSKSNKFVDGHRILEENIAENFSITVARRGDKTAHNEEFYSLLTIVKYYDDKFLFVGDTYDYSYILESATFKKITSNISFFRVSNATNQDDSYRDFLNNIEIKDNYNGLDATYAIFGTPINYSKSAGEETIGDARDIKPILEQKNMNELLMGYIKDDYYVQVNGSLLFNVTYLNRKAKNRKMLRLDNEDLVYGISSEFIM